MTLRHTTGVSTSAERMRRLRASNPEYRARERILNRARYRRKLAELEAPRREAIRRANEARFSPEARAAEAARREEMKARNRESVREFNRRVHGDPDWSPPPPTW